jgi:acyl-CoA synthetase (AMP-forming)/AMP-acid ligase II
MASDEQRQREALYRRRGWWSEATVWSRLTDCVARDPHRPALCDPPNRAAICGGSPRQLDFATVAAEAQALARRLAALGIVPGDVLLVQLPNVVEAVIVWLAAARLGCIFSPIAVQYREHELADLIERAEPRLLITAGRIDNHAHAAMAATVAGGRVRVAAFGSELPEGVIGLDTLPDPGGALGPEPDATRALTICWTSGTEGRPKGVVRNHQRWLCLTQASIDAARLQPGATLLNPYPIAHMAAFVGFLLPWLDIGGTLLMHHPFALDVFAAQLASRRIDFTAAPPALLNLMLLRPEIAQQAHVGAVPVIGSGGAPLAPATVTGMREQFGVEILNLYGSSEGGSLVSGPDDAPDPAVRAVCFPRWGAPGLTWSSRMAERVETRLVDVASGTDITAPGQPGELRFRGPGVFAGYYRDPEATARAFDPQGFYRSGDLFEITGDHAQYFRFVGRCKDLIIRGGVNIAPEEIEGLLLGHPDIADAAVVGYADPVMGEKLCAVLVPRTAGRPSLEDIRSYLREERRIAAYKLPERIEWRASLPRNALGKVVRRELRL